MNTNSRRHALPAALLIIAIIIAASPCLAQAQSHATTPAMSITVSIERPTTHYYHVVFRADGLKGETQDFKMPAWTPGYYRIMDYAKNVKSIRPVALGPFDYDRENYTNLLWFSEGVTVYYEFVLLNRAGLMTRDEVFERLGSTIADYENALGRRHQPATVSSFDTWINFFSRGEHAANTTISYYDIGAGLGLLLDLKIREASKGRSSLDDVMRTLYRTFYKEKKRGFTDREFREVCERAAGVPLDEIFDVYAATIKEWDYAKYLDWAGLAIDLEPRPTAGPWFGASTQDQNGSPVVSSVDPDSPASLAGLTIQDEILAFDGARVTQRSLAGRVGARKPGDKIKVLYARRGAVHETEAVLGEKTERSFRITPLANPTPHQKALLDAWLIEK